ncbi:MAG: formylmethanofuran dehydrogenase subunit C [Methanomicrobiales archaeon]|nr:formylmethanofuran dehydrogenase subunit C [Methanomicrobiales archaeon]
MARPRAKPSLPVEAESIIPQNFLRGTDLTVYEGNKERRLEELFFITVEGPAVSPDQVEVVLMGATGRVKRVGEYMNAGRIVIEGDIGMHCGNFMSGGEIVIKSNADAWLGREMRGGRITCMGSTSHNCGAGYRGEKRGMRGGTIEIFGGAGDFAGEYLAGGEVRIHGSCGDMAGIEMRGGLLVIGGTVTRPCGNMTAGTAVVLGHVNRMLPTFQYQGVNDEVWDGKRLKMDVWEGDVANRGKGRLLVAVGK